MVFFKIPLCPVSIIFDALIKDEFWIVDFSRDNKRIDTIVIYPGDPLLDSTQIDSSLLFNDFGMFPHQDVVLVQISLLIDIIELLPIVGTSARVQILLDYFLVVDVDRTLRSFNETKLANLKFVDDV